MKRFALIAGCVLWLGLCGLIRGNDSPVSATKSGDRKLADQARAVLVKNCAKCHGNQARLGGKHNVYDHSTLIAANKRGRLIVPGDLKKSRLWQRIDDGTMPEDGEISDADKETIRKWIEAGAPEYRQLSPPPRPFVSHKDILKAIRDHLGKADEEDRPHLRYFTLAHLHNNPDITSEQLGRFRAALSRALNGLHWYRAMVFPEAVDPSGTVLAIDLRELSWDRKEHEKTDRWTLLLYRYPYGIDGEGSRDDELADLEKEVNRLTRNTLVHVRADWFVAQATRSPVYEALLRLPHKASDLEFKLGVDVASNFKRNRLWRAGFVRSAVSRQNRLVERHVALYGSFWKTYDFKPGSERGDLLQFPLGPVSFKRAYPPAGPSKYSFEDVAFRHDSTQMIFNLPNGLQGYYLGNGKDELISEGPLDVINDSMGEFSGGPEIVNALSCMCCHIRGIQPLRNGGDDVREGCVVAGPARRKVRKIYAPRDDMNRVIAEDSALFLAAVRKATERFLVGEDRVKAEADFSTVEEPIGELVRRFYYPNMKLDQVAYELGFKKPDELREQIKSKERLQKLGLAVLLNGGAIRRADWERIAAVSRFQRVARELGQGTPWRILD